MGSVVGVVDHGRCRLFDVVLEHRSHRVKDGHRQWGCVDGVHHVADPTISLGLPDDEPKVAGPKSRMPTLLRVAAWPAPVLRKEQRRTPTRLGEVFGVDLADNGIVFNSVEETIDNRLEVPESADRFVERDMGFTTLRWTDRRVRWGRA